MKMATYYHGATRRRSYFEGWYLKHQTQSGRALSLIPALHIDAEGRRTASLQVITECVLVAGISGAFGRGTAVPDSTGGEPV